MAAMLGFKDADTIGRGAGNQDILWNAAAPFLWNIPKHFGRPKSAQELEYLEGEDLGRELHLVEDNSPGGPHQLVDCGDPNGCYGFLDTAISILKHAERNLRGDSPDNSPNRQGGWEAAWNVLAFKAGRKEPFPAGVITHITKFVNDLTIVGSQYISPTGEVSNSGTTLPGNAILVDSQIIDGVRVNIWEIPKPMKKTKIDVQQDSYGQDVVRGRRLDQKGSE